MDIQPLLPHHLQPHLPMTVSRPLVDRPASRQPLCERRKVSLTIDPISYRDWNRVYDCNCHIASDDDDNCRTFFHKEEDHNIHEEESDSELEDDHEGTLCHEEEENHDTSEEEFDSELEDDDDDDDRTSCDEEEEDCDTSGSEESDDEPEDYHDEKDEAVYEVVDVVYEGEVITKIGIIHEGKVFEVDVVYEDADEEEEEDRKEYGADEEDSEEYDDDEEEGEEGEEYERDVEDAEGEYDSDDADSGDEASSDEEEEEEEEETEQNERSLLPPIKDNHLVEIEPGFYIALMDGDEDVTALRTFENKAFTHILQLRYTEPTGPNWRIEETPRNAPLQYLDLICPAACLRQYCRYSSLDFEQLYAARDFLTLVLPLGSERWWPEELRGKDQCGQGQEQRYTQAPGQEEGDDDDSDAQVVTLARDLGLDYLLDEVSSYRAPDTEVNVLIVAPTLRAVDVLSILYCYLAFLEDADPEDYINGGFSDEAWERVKFGRYTLSNMKVCSKA